MEFKWDKTLIRENRILEEYSPMRASYVGLLLMQEQEHEIDTELVSSVIFHLQNCKAPVVARLTGEHLILSHPSPSVVLCKLRQDSDMVILYLFYIIKETRSKAMSGRSRHSRNCYGLVNRNSSQCRMVSHIISTSIIRLFLFYLQYS